MFTSMCLNKDLFNKIQRFIFIFKQLPWLEEAVYRKTLLIL